jgi:anti-anti-sigma factor
MTDHVLHRSGHETARGLTSAASRDTPMPGQLELHRLDDRDRVTLVLAGELDMASAPKLDQALRELEATDPLCIVVDLRDLAFMDSSGLALLRSAARRIRFGVSSH